MIARAVAVLALCAACGSRSPAPPMTTAQLEAAAVELDTRCTEAPDRLPVHGSAELERLIAPKNRDAIVAGPLAERVIDHGRHTGALLRMYNTFMRCGRPVETLAVNAALLEGYANSMADGEAVIAALPADAPERARKRAAVERKIAGLRGGIGSTIGMLADPALPVVPLPLATRLGSAIDAVRAATPPGALDEPLAQLDAAIAATSEPARRDALAAVRAAVR